jgi:hypothetical protein
VDRAQSQARRTNRRQLFSASALALPVIALSEVATDARATQGETPTGDDDQHATAPDWSFGLLSVQDPYTGTIQVPPMAAPGTRYVAAEVEIDNASDQPLAFTPAEIRIRDESGTDFRGGSALGTEPSINQRNLNGGERSRGWVWFTVPTGSKLVEIVYVGPQPHFRIALPE